MSETPSNTLQYRFDGPEDGPVLILGPSLGTTWHMWDRQIPELSRHWRVLRFDLPGHGGAAAHPAHSIPDLAERLLGTLDKLGIDRFGYAGCSIGGAIGAELALRHPLRLGSLALVSAAPRFGTADSYRQRGVVVRTNGLDPIARATPDRWFTPMFAAGQPAIVDWSVQMVRTTDPGCYIAACEALAAFDIRAELGRIGAPTLVVVGADDEVTPPADARVMVAGIPDARLALVPGASHLAPVEQPTAVTDLLVRHFSASWQSADQPTGMTAIPTPAARSMLATAPPTGVPVNGFPVNGVPVNGVPVNGAANGAVNGVANGVHITGAPVAEISYVEPGSALVDTRSDAYEKGIRVRREVLGDAHVDRAQSNADEFTGDFQDFITRYAWGEVWNRPGLDRRTRSVITLTALAARGHLDELAFHTRAALRNGLTPAEIKEVLLHTAVYCGVPTANSAFAVAQRVIREETTPEG